MKIETVGVVGCGLMGSGIAEVVSKAEFSIVVCEMSEDLVEAGRQRIDKSLSRAVERGKLERTDRNVVLDRLSFSTDLAALTDCDLVIEAIVEDIKAKNELFSTLDGLCGPEAIFASNTSSLTITDMAAATNRPGRVVGLHFFNPVPVMKLVEVIRTIATRDDVFDAVFSFTKDLGKQPISAKDNSGFVVNLLLVPYMLDAIRHLERGVASVEDIDRAMTLGLGHPMGPFTLCDFVGIDTLCRISEIMFNEYREERYAPPPLLKRIVSMGRYGRKSGQGFYDWSEDPPEPLAL